MLMFEGGDSDAFVDGRPGEQSFFAAESRTRATPSNLLLSVRPLQRKLEFSTDLDPEAGQRTSVSAVMERLSLSSSFATRMSVFAQG